MYRDQIYVQSTTCVVMRVFIFIFYIPYFTINLTNLSMSQNAEIQFDLSKKFIFYSSQKIGIFLIGFIGGILGTAAFNFYNRKKGEFVRRG